MQLPSRLIEEAVESFAKLPGIGKKTALRLVMHLIKQSVDESEQFGEAIIRMRRDIRFCNSCHNISDGDQCSICADKRRDETLICLVENIRDVIAIENTNQYGGKYHVLGGVISPIDGIGPDQLNIGTLEDRIKKDGVKEIIMALSPTIEGDTTVYYLSKKIADREVKITTLARGIAFGGELEYADEMTLARSIATRTTVEKEAE